MGRRKPRGKRVKRERPDVWDPAMATKTFRLTATKNELLERYYRAQPFLTQEICDELFETYRRELPLAFRLTGGRQSSETVKRVLKERYFSRLTGLHLDTESGSLQPIQLPTELPWYPGGLAYQMSLPRKVVRKSPTLNSFHNFLVTENETGTLSRQETVSMVPPLFLRIQPGDKILDMCAAPGSKTAQLIEILENECELANPGKAPDGLILANDSDNKRCYLLVHQALKRHGTCTCAVTNHDAGVFPNVFIAKNDKTKSNFAENDDASMEILKYDRILCDVPCSGDGTLRKNLDIWSNWKIQNAHNLHILQVRIAKRGIDLLEIGGRMVYSTCSLNPVENEATLIQILEYANGSVELVDVSSELPTLKRMPGIFDWKIMDKSGDFVENYEKIEKKHRGPMPPTIFPNPELARKHHLERSFRILPQFQDTGGFFVAVLTKTRPLNSTSEPEVKKSPTQGSEVNSPQNHPEVMKSPPKKKAKTAASARRGRGFREDPFIYPTPEELAKVSGPMSEYFGISPNFPFDQLLYRCEPETGGKNRNFYFTNELLTNVLRNNDLDKLHVINAGVRIFHRVDPTAGGFRLAQDGFRLVAPFMSRRIFAISNSDAVKVLTCEKFVPLEDLREDFREELEKTEEGTVGLRCFELEQKVLSENGGGEGGAENEKIAESFDLARPAVIPEEPPVSAELAENLEKEKNAESLEANPVTGQKDDVSGEEKLVSAKKQDENPQNEKDAGSLEMAPKDAASLSLACQKDAASLPKSIDFIAFRGKSTIAPYVAREMRLHLLRLLGHDTTQMEESLISNRRSRQVKKEEKALETGKIEENSNVLEEKMEDLGEEREERNLDGVSDDLEEQSPDADNEEKMRRET